MHKFSHKKETLNPKTNKYHLLQNDKPVTYSDWIKNIQTSEDFILFFNSILQKSAFESYFWEVKPLTEKQVQDSFEFVLVKSTALDHISQNQTSFVQYFEKDKAVVAFPNIRGDAQLIVPTNISNITKYAHIANFVRSASTLQLLDFWKSVGREFENMIGPNTKWLSTSGLGVHWLHVRIDSRPKYYQHVPYKLRK